MKIVGSIPVHYKF